MKVLLIGATGTLGLAIGEVLAAAHDVIRVGNRTGNYRVDISDEQSVLELFDKVGRIDAIVSAAGNTHFSSFLQMTTEQFNNGLQSKLLGQVRLVLLGHPYLNDRGSITVTTGILGQSPIRYASNATTVNAALEGFVRAAAIELPRGIRINAVSPTVVCESWEKYGAFFAGFEPMPAQRVALAYRRSIEGAQTGQVY